jgi:hypothetical protein
MSNPPFKPTEQQRRTVSAMCAYGVPEDKIAAVIEIDPKTLRKHFRRELDLSTVEANSKVAQTLFKMATSGTTPAATFFWLKTRAKWKEVHNMELTGADGGPVQHSIKVKFD